MLMIFSIQISIGQECFNNTIAETYYIPLDEELTLATLKTIFPGAESCDCNAIVPIPESPIVKNISIVGLRDNTILIYDHWEDGYELDILNPTQPSTRIYGDSELSNGDSGQNSDGFDLGQVLTLNGLVDVPRNHNAIFFDAKDKFVTTAPVSVAVSTWAGKTETLFGGASVVNPVKGGGTEFTIPVGIDNNFQGMFDYVGAFIQSYADSNLIEVYEFNQTIPDTTFYLQEGENYLLDGKVNTGTKIKSDSNILTTLIAGDICANYELRFFEILPDDKLSNIYTSPVGSPESAATVIHLYNPHETTITIKWYTRGYIMRDSFSIAPMDVYRLTMDEGSGAMIASDSTFIGISTVDSYTDYEVEDCLGDSGSFPSKTHDWGFTLVPESIMKRQILGIAFAPGMDPYYDGDLVENSSPVWVIGSSPSGVDPIPSFTLCVDYNGDGGSLIDDIGNRYDSKITLEELESYKLYDPDGDQTGMSLWVCDGSKTLLSAAWGQDPAAASSGSPAVDVGTTILSTSTAGISKTATIRNDLTRSDILVGDTITYCICVSNLGKLEYVGNEIDNLDELSSSLSYVENSTVLTYLDQEEVLPDDTFGSPFVLDEDGWDFPQKLNRGQNYNICFDAVVNALVAGNSEICNTAYIFDGVDKLESEICLSYACDILVGSPKFAYCDDSIQHFTVDVEWVSPPDTLIELQVQDSLYLIDPDTIIGNTYTLPFFRSIYHTSLEIEAYFRGTSCGNAVTYNLNSNCSKNLEINKDVLSTTRVDSNLYKVIYEISVNNNGTSALAYDLFDHPKYDDDVSIYSSVFYEALSSIGTSINLINNEKTLLLEDVSIDSQETQSYYIEVLVHLILDDEVGDNSYDACDSEQTQPFNGLYNIASIAYDSNGLVVKESDVCSDIVYTDLALIKQVSSLRSSYKNGALIDFELTVQNQGSTTISEFSIIDYLPCGLKFQSENNINWTVLPDGNLSYKHEGSFAPNDVEVIELTLSISPCQEHLAYTNYAEIASAYEQNGMLAWDVDSTPDTIWDNDAIVQHQLNDSSDEDDHDYIRIPVYDLALIKTSDAEQLPLSGQSISYDVTLFNQGNEAVKNILIVDYLPCGMLFDEANNATWSYSEVEHQAQITIDEIVNPGESLDLTLIGIVNDCIEIGAYRNVVEIVAANDLDNNLIVDIDSDADLLPNNDQVIDDQINNPMDEDDHDIHTFDKFDLALIKTFDPDQDFRLGALIDFEIEVYNQGSITAKNIKIQDYLPCGLAFNSEQNNNWSLEDDALTYTIEETLEPGASISVGISLELIDCNNRTIGYANISEIISAEDTNGITMEDSDGMFDDNDSNDPVIDDEIDDPMDEDNHDIAVLPIFDLALIKTFDASQSMQFGDTIVFDIHLVNQGNTPASSITIGDYLPCGLRFMADLNDGWIANEDVLTFEVESELLPEEVVELALFVVLQDCNSNSAYINIIEIIDSPSDFDSIADNDEGNDHLVDDALNHPLDEDDHDIAILNPYDLALKLTGPEEASIGDTITLTMHAYNQGVFPVTDVEYVLYLDQSYELLPELNPKWNVGNCNEGELRLEEDEKVMMMETSVIMPGESMIIDVMVKYHGQEGYSYAYGEVVQFSNMAGISSLEQKIFDWDSYPDCNKSNDFGGEAESFTDDLITSRAPIDEDDHDPFRLLSCGQLPCIQHVNISLDQNCESVLTLDMFITSGVIDETEYAISFSDDAGNILDSSFDDTDVGQTFNYTVTLLDCNNSCWGTITIEDKLPPEIVCEDLTIACNALPSVAPPAIIDDNCAGGSITQVNEVVISLPCDPDYTACVVRTFRATDVAGIMSDECEQKIFLRRVDLSGVTFPENATLECDAGYATDDNGYPAPSVSGVPMNGGVGIFPEIPDELCSVYLTYTDVELPTSDCSDKIMRTWQLREWWCGGETTIGGFQIIEVLDNNGPALTCGGDITVSTEYGCIALVDIPSIIAVDACSDIESYLINTGSGVLYTNGGSLELLEGTHTVTYSVYDKCYNSSECSITVTVQDLSEPVPICEQNLIVSIGQSGESVVYAETFDTASFDECGPVTFQVRRMEDNCNNIDNTEWADRVVFCCEDINTTQMVELLVTDASSNTNRCMVLVNTQDKLPPTMECPIDMVIDCTEAYDLDNLGFFYGNPVVIDNCSGASNVVETVEEDVNQCGLGTIVRTFTLDNGTGVDPIVCVQNIVIENYDPFDFGDIVWPEDVSVDNSCSLADFHPEVLNQGYPQFTEDQCDLVGMNYEDEVFEFVIGTDACVKILRKWKVIDWCQTTNTSVAIDSFTQILILNNTIDPEIGACNDIQIATFDTQCSAAQVAVLAPSVTDDCTPQQDVQWHYEITYADGTILNGTGPDASGEYPLGTHVITWTALDRCGNFDTCSHEIRVVNEKLPIPICINGLSVDLNPMDLDNDGTIDAEMSTLWAEDFNKDSYHQCGYDVVVSFSTDITDTSLVLDCDELGIESVDMYVTVIDASGNPYLDLNGDPLQSYCTTFVEVQDNNDADVCPDVTDPSISGRITLEDGSVLDGAHVNLINGITTETTGEAGTYDFGTMPFGGSYVVQPYHNIDHQNGVSTLDIILIQRHLMNKQPLASAYQMIAADANNSGSISAADMVDIRKLILEMYSEYPSNTSWRFVDAEQQFLDNMNPWGQGIDETYQILQLAQDMEIDFIAMKVGDINGSVEVSDNQANLELRGAPMQLNVVKGHNQVHICASEDMQLEGFQLELDIDGDAKELFSILDDFSSKNYYIDDHKVRVSYSGQKSFNVKKGHRLISIVLTPDAKIKLSESFKNEGYVGANIEVREIKLLHEGQDLIITTYPNPAINTLTLEMTVKKTNSDVLISISNEAGQRVLSNQMLMESADEGKYRYQVDVSSYARGVYTVEVQVGTEREVKKLILID